ncbi:MAG: hypothetical protein ACOYNC_15915 [Bacteroidales bacterium]
MNQILQQNPWFTPSPGTLYKWLATRKNPTPGTGFYLPGLFDTAGFGTDAFLFSMAVFLEVIGIASFFIYFGNIVFAALFFLLDFIFAVAAHWNQGRSTELKNQLALIRDFTFGEAMDTDHAGYLKPIEARKAWRIQKINRFKLITVIFYAGICLLAVYKVYGFINGWTESGEDFGVVPLLIAITYALVAFIHIYATGYFFAELNLRRLANREARAHQFTLQFSTNSGAPYSTRDIHLREGLSFTSQANAIQCNNHWLECNTLSTFGVLTDAQIIQIWGQINDPQANDLNEKRESFLKYALYHQLSTILFKVPVVNPAPPLIPPPRPQAPVFPLPHATALRTDDHTYMWFMPGVDTKKLWYSTRKSSSGEGTFRFPWLNGTTGLIWDRIKFFSAILLEFTGLMAFYFFLGNILFVSLFFLIDFICAVGAHANKGRWAELKNQIGLINQEDQNPYLFANEQHRDCPGGTFNPQPTRVAWRRRKVNKFKIYSFLFYLLIGVLAAYKTYGFINGWQETGETFGVIPILITITYILVAYLHITATGNFFAEENYIYRKNKEFMVHKLTHQFSIPNPPGFLTMHIDQPAGVTMSGVYQQGPHYLENHDLYTWGILTDQQIENFCSALPPAQRPGFKKAAIYHQLENVTYFAPVDGPPTVFPRLPEPPHIAQAHQEPKNQHDRLF